jgi:hypothetical protein
MPTHPELTAAATQNIAQWILQHTAKPGISYYIGAAGALRMDAPVAPAQKGACILTASYIDHGLKEAPAQQLKGQDKVVIHSR